MTDSAYACCRISVKSHSAWERREVDYEKCDMTLAALLLKGHLATQHGVYSTEEFLPELLEERDAQIYDAWQSSTGLYLCPFPDCEHEETFCILTLP